MKQTNGYKLDKNHTFVCNLFSDLEMYEKTPEEWQPPEPQPYKDHGNLKSFMLNSDCVDQFRWVWSSMFRLKGELNHFYGLSVSLSQHHLRGRGKDERVHVDAAGADRGDAA